MSQIKKAVILAAGFGSRFLPATKAIAKEMFLLVDKPALQVLVEELSNAGVQEICIVSNKRKTEIKKHFTENKLLYERLKLDNKPDLLAKASAPEKLAKICFVNQKQQLGVASAILCAKKFVGKDPFIMLGGDEMFIGNCAKEMIDLYNQTGLQNIGCLAIPQSEIIGRYGNVQYKEKNGIKLSTGIVEKPTKEQVQGNLIFLCRAVLNGDVMQAIGTGIKTDKTEKFFSDTILANIAKRNELAVCEIKSRRFDTGNFMGYFEAFVQFALNDERYGKQVQEYLKGVGK